MIENALTGARWFKSSKSNGQANCVEVAVVGGARAVRDSKNPESSVLVFGPGALAALVARLGDPES